MFLRMGCMLPDRLNLRLEQFCKTWISLEGTMSTVPDVKARNAGWHFVRLEEPIPVLESALKKNQPSPKE